MFLKILILIIILVILIQMYKSNFETINKENFIISNSKTNTKTNIISNPKSKLNTQEITQIDERILFNNKDYNQNLSIDNKDNTYYYDDMIDQSNINENAFNIIYSVDPIDYSNVKTGIDKCNKDCNGICFENGYDGIATCYPYQQQTFDWGTLYKNPTFTYGYNAYGPENLPQ